MDLTGLFFLIQHFFSVHKDLTERSFPQILPLRSTKILRDTPRYSEILRDTQRYSEILRDTQSSVYCTMPGSYCGISTPYHVQPPSHKNDQIFMEVCSMKPVPEDDRGLLTIWGETWPGLDEVVVFSPQWRPGRRCVMKYRRTLATGCRFLTRTQIYLDGIFLELKGTTCR